MPNPSLSSVKQMADKSVQMPSSGAGLTRYFDDAKTKVEFKPGHIVALAVVVMVLIILLQLYGKGLFGI